MGRLVATAGVIALLSGCGTVHYRNFTNPSYGQTEFDRDRYECRRENTAHAAAMAAADRAATTPSPYIVSPSTMAIHLNNLVEQCMAARGWRQVKELEPPRSAPQPLIALDEPFQRTHERTLGFT